MAKNLGGKWWGGEPNLLRMGRRGRGKPLPSLFHVGLDNDSSELLAQTVADEQPSTDSCVSHCCSSSHGVATSFCRAKGDLVDLSQKLLRSG